MYDKTIFMNSKLVDKVAKNDLEEIRFSVLKNNMVDVRINLYFHGEAEPRPTKKGIWLSFKYFPKIFTMLENLAKDSSKEITLEFEKSKSTKIRIYNAEFKSEMLIHFRTFYLKDNEYKPGKGVSFSVALIPKVVEALKKAEQLKEI